jgi:CDP-glucose 4,6-dehydratase
LEDVVSMAAPTERELREAYAGKRVLLTGHTGFKGGWLALWLKELGAEVFGYALAPDTSPAFFEVARVARACARSTIADLRDAGALQCAVAHARPDFVFHLAAQPLVRVSYDDPIGTLETNVLGTARMLEALRRARSRCAVVVVTSDKCYENREWHYGYREDDAMGGYDVYSMSKGAAELVVSSFRRSFFPPAGIDAHGIALASARAGNVVGGGDWAKDRILPDCIAALADGKPIQVRNPDSVRPWQYVLEPLGGYLLLGVRLAGHGSERRDRFCEAWNFGPRVESARSVRELVEAAIEAWGGGTWEDRRDPRAPHEAGLLRLSIEKAHGRLGWMPRWDFGQTIEAAVAWYRAFHREGAREDLSALALAQIHDYMRAEVAGGGLEPAEASVRGAAASE